VLARLAAEQLIERRVERLALDVPERQVDSAERVQPLLTGRVEPVHERACQIISVSNAFLPMTLRATLRTVSGDPPCPTPVMPASVSTSTTMLLCGKACGPVRVVVRGIEHADLRNRSLRQS
jgi:hypothetical protein